MRATVKACQFGIVKSLNIFVATVFLGRCLSEIVLLPKGRMIRSSTCTSQDEEYFSPFCPKWVEISLTYSRFALFFSYGLDVRLGCIQLCLPPWRWKRFEVCERSEVDEGSWCNPWMVIETGTQET